MCLSTQLGACSHPTGRPTVPYWCTLDVRTFWAFHGVPTGPPGPRWAPTGPRRTAGRSVRLIFIGGPRFGRPAAPIGAGRGYCKANDIWPHCVSNGLSDRSPTLQRQECALVSRYTSRVRPRSDRRGHPAQPVWGSSCASKLRQCLGSRACPEHLLGSWRKSNLRGLTAV